MDSRGSPEPRHWPAETLDGDGRTNKAMRRILTESPSITESMFNSARYGPEARISGGMAADIMAQPLQEGVTMGHIRARVCRVDDEAPDRMIEITDVDLPQLDPASVSAGAALDTLEATTLEVGHTLP